MAPEPTERGTWNAERGIKSGKTRVGGKNGASPPRGARAEGGSRTAPTRASIINALELFKRKPSLSGKTSEVW